jgi:CubicO group peptidase (beta-lactamase class C family)
VWEEVNPESQGISQKKLAEAVTFLEQNSGSDGVKELMIVRNGVVVWQGENIDKVHGVWSLTKSFTSTMLGLLIDQQRCKLNTFAATVVPALEEDYSLVTLGHFTTMTSGYRAIGDEPRGTYKHGPSLTPFLPSPESLFKPGEKFAYWDSAMNEFAYVLSKIAAEPLDSLFAKKIAQPIGMDPKDWFWKDFGLIDGLRVNGGSGNNDRAMNICSRALARFGYLFLKQGNWNGQQLISPDWISAATSVQVPASVPLTGFVDHGPGSYGFNWWVNGVDAEGKRKWPDAPLGSYAASGYNNNDMFIIPEWQMVIVRLGLDQQEFFITDQIYSKFLGKVGEAILEK